jgi:hypothetical protein
VSSRDNGHDPGNRAGDPPLWANLLPPVLGLIGIGTLACAVWAFGFNDNYSGAEPVPCAAIADNPSRLACYDQIATPHSPAKGALAPVRIYPSGEMK